MFPDEYQSRGSGGIKERIELMPAEAGMEV